MSGPALASLVGVHAGWSWVVVVGNGLAGLWSLGAAWRPSLRVRALWWFTAAAEVAVFVQAGLGAALLGQDRRVEDLHTFYGFLAIVAVAIIYSYRQQLRHRLYLLYGVGGLFVMGLCIRAMVLNPS